MEKEQLLEMEMEKFMKLAKIFYVFMIVVLIFLMGLSAISISNSKSINYLANQDLQSKQDYIIEVNGKKDKVDSEAVKPQIETALKYCENPEIVHANGNDVSNECNELNEYSNENYGG